MKDDDFKLLKGFALGRTDERTNKRTDICDCRGAFATENYVFNCFTNNINAKDHRENTCLWSYKCLISTNSEK